jgi:hypothetical protein
LESIAAAATNWRHAAERPSGTGPRAASCAQAAAMPATHAMPANSTVLIAAPAFQPCPPAAPEDTLSYAPIL